MGLLSFLKRRSADAPSAASDGVDSVQQARVRARQRLIGAVVLVAAGVIGFPVLFETQPRPLSVNTPIEIARRDADTTTAGSGAAMPPSSSPERPPARGPAAVERHGDAAAVITESAADSGREVSAPAASSAAARSSDEKAEKGASAATHPAVPAAASKPEGGEKKPAVSEKKPAASDKKPDPAPLLPSDKSRAEALLSGHDAPAHNKPATPTEADAGRYVVQVGAFGDTVAAREARQKVEKLGLKTYTQVVETSAGKRIRVRVGPFASRAEADKAAGKVKGAGLASAVFTL